MQIGQLNLNSSGDVGRYRITPQVRVDTFQREGVFPGFVPDGNGGLQIIYEGVLIKVEPEPRSNSIAVSAAVLSSKGVLNRNVSDQLKDVDDVLGITEQVQYLMLKAKEHGWD